MQDTPSLTSKAELPSGRADPALLEMLVCPRAHVPLRYDSERQELVSDQAGLAYPIRDGIPVLLPDQARILTPYGK